MAQSPVFTRFNTFDNVSILKCVFLRYPKILLQEGNILLEKDAIEPVLNHENPTGFYSTFFLVPKKNGVSLPDSDISLPSDSSQLLFFLGIRKEDPQPDPDFLSLNYFPSYLSLYL
jgi:hypothetical protein